MPRSRPPAGDGVEYEMADDDKGQSDKDLDKDLDRDDDDADDVDDTDDDAADKDDDKSDKDKDKSSKDADRIAALEAQLEKRSKSVKLARADRERLEKELKQLREKDLPEIDKLKTELSESKAELEKRDQHLKQTRLELAFLRDNTYTWRNPATALKLADLSKVDVDDDGEVTGLKAALDALAKSDDYLLVSKSDKDDDDKDKDDDGKPKGSTGSANNRNRSGGTDRKKLVSRFPSMRTRGVPN